MSGIKHTMLEAPGELGSEEILSLGTCRHFGFCFGLFFVLLVQIACQI